MPGHWGGSTSRSTSRSSSGSHSRSYNPGAGGVVSHAPAPTRTYERSHHPTQGVVTHAPITPAPVAPLTGHPVPTEQEISQANLKAFVRDQEEKRQLERGNQYDPTFRQRIRMGMNRLGQGIGNIGRGIGSMAMMMNPFAVGAGLAGNRQAGMLMNLLTRGKRQRGNQYFDPDEARDIERELSMMAPYSTNYLKNLDLSKYDTPTDLQDIDFGIGNFDLGTFGFDKDKTIEQDQDLATQRFVEGPKSQLEVWQEKFGDVKQAKALSTKKILETDWANREIPWDKLEPGSVIGAKADFERLKNNPDIKTWGDLYNAGLSGETGLGGAQIMTKNKEALEALAKELPDEGRKLKIEDSPFDFDLENLYERIPGGGTDRYHLNIPLVGEETRKTMGLTGRDKDDFLQPDVEQQLRAEGWLAHGGRVGFSEGGIVGLWRELSSL